MIRRVLFSGDGFPWLRRGMDVSETRHRTTAENVANALTPGYRARRVAFEELLPKATKKLELTRTSEVHLGPRETIDARVVPSDDPVLPNGINNVDVEREMAEMGVNRIQISALSRFAAKQYRLLSLAIRGDSQQ